MFMLSSACVVCDRDHLSPHDLSCLVGPFRSRAVPAPSPDGTTSRWWLAVPELDGLCENALTSAMQDVRWRRFDGLADAEITHLSLALQTSRWVLAAYARSVGNTLPFTLIAIRHANRVIQRDRTFWIAGTHTGEAAVFALDLSRPAAA